MDTREVLDEVLQDQADEKVIFQPESFLRVGKLDGRWVVDIEGKAYFENAAEPSTKPTEEFKLTRRQIGKYNYQNVTRRYVRMACGHKFIPETEPRHRGCETCWFSFFNAHGELTKAVEEAFQSGGEALILKLKSRMFLTNWLKFMSTVAQFVEVGKTAQAKANAEKEGNSIEGTSRIEGDNAIASTTFGDAGTSDSEFNNSYAAI